MYKLLKYMLGVYIYMLGDEMHIDTNLNFQIAERSTPVKKKPKYAISSLMNTRRKIF